MKKSILIATFILLLVVGWIGSGQFSNSVVAQNEETQEVSKTETSYYESSENNESEEFISLEGELVFAKSQRLIIGNASAKLKNKASMELENLSGKFTATEIE